MSALLKQLRAKRAELGGRIKKMSEETVGNVEADWSSDDRASWDALLAEYDALGERIEALEAAAEREEREETRLRQREGAIRGEYDSSRSRLGAESASAADRQGEERSRDLETVFATWARAQFHDEARGRFEMSDREREAFDRTGLSPRQREIELPLLRGEEFRAFRSDYERRATTSNNASVIPQTLVASIEEALLAYGDMRRWADVIRTAGGEELRLPTTNGTGANDEGEWIAEGAASTTQDVTTTHLALLAHKIGSKAIKVTPELLQDSAIDFAGLIGRRIGERLARGTNRGFTTGDNSSKPNGIVTAAPAGVTAASTSTVTDAEVLALIHSVDPAYRDRPSFRLMFHDDILEILRGIKDSEGRPLWQASISEGAPETIYGKRFVVNNHMPTPAASARVIVAGDMSKYVIREVAGVRVHRLEELFRVAEDSDAFVGFMRVDGDLLDAGTNPVKRLTLAAS